MPERGIIWAKWRVNPDGRVEVTATYAAESGYLQERSEYASLDEAASELGASFREVVGRAMESGSLSGRWRP
jgi:hypothetical protein